MTSTLCLSHSKETSITISLDKEKENLTFILHLKINNWTMKCVFFSICLFGAVGQQYNQGLLTCFS